MPHPGERIWIPFSPDPPPCPEILRDTESKPGGLTLTQYSIQPAERLLLAAFSEVYSEDCGGEAEQETQKTHSLARQRGGVNDAALTIEETVVSTPLLLDPFVMSSCFPN